MESYSSLVGKRVEAHYRAGDMNLSAIGILESDSGESIFLEERFTQGGRDKKMRVEIPYECIIRVTEVPANPARSARGTFSWDKKRP